MAEIPDWMVAIVDLAADQLALDTGCCPCPCHAVIQPGLVPCPRCELVEVAFEVGEDVGVHLGAQFSDLPTQVAAQGIHPIDHEEEDAELAGQHREDDGHRRLKDRHPLRIGTLRANWNAGSVTTGPLVPTEPAHSSRYDAPEEGP